MKVFLVEDSPLLRERLVAMIAALGATLVGQAAGADEAIRAIQANPPEAVVLDIHLEQGNGFDVLRALGKVLPGTSFYVLTNHPHEQYRATAEKLGARGFFDKSAEFDRLREALAARIAGAPAP